MQSDTQPPRLFNTVTARETQYNMDTVEYLIAQENQRRFAAGQSGLSQTDVNEFRRQLVSKLIIQGDAMAATTLRPQTSVREQLNG